MSVSYDSEKRASDPNSGPCPKRIMVFDDSKGVDTRFKEVFENDNAEILAHRGLNLDPRVRDALAGFRPNLIVLDLLGGENRDEGYRLVREIEGVDFLLDVPIVIFRNLIPAQVQ